MIMIFRRMIKFIVEWAISREVLYFCKWSEGVDISFCERSDDLFLSVNESMIIFLKKKQFYFQLFEWNVSIEK